MSVGIDGAAAELRERINDWVPYADRRDHMLALLDRLTAPREWKADEEICLAQTEDIRIRCMYDEDGDFFTILEFSDLCGEERDRAIYAALLGVPLTLPKPQPPTFGPDSEPITEEEARRLPSGAKLIGKHSHSDRTFIGLNPRKAGDIYILDGDGPPRSVCYGGSVPADAETAVALGREPAGKREGV